MAFDHKKFEEEFRLPRRSRWEVSLDEVVETSSPFGFFDHEPEVLTHLDVLDEGSVEPSEFTGGESVGPYELCVFLELREKVHQTLCTLRPRDERIVRRRFGLWESYDHDETLEQIGNDFQLAKESIRRLEARGLRCLRHVSRSKYLSLFADCPEETPTHSVLYRWQGREDKKMRRRIQSRISQQPKKRADIKKAKEERKRLKKKRKKRDKLEKERRQREQRGLLTMKQLAVALKIDESEAELLIAKHRDSHPYGVAEYTLADGKRKEYFTPAILEAIQIECLSEKGWMTLGEMQQKFCINKKVIFSFAIKQRNVHPEWFCCIKRTSYHSPEFIQAFKEEYDIG